MFPLKPVCPVFLDDAFICLVKGTGWWRHWCRRWGQELKVSGLGCLRGLTFQQRSWGGVRTPLSSPCSLALGLGQCTPSEQGQMCSTLPAAVRVPHLPLWRMAFPLLASCHSLWLAMHECANGDGCHWNCTQLNSDLNCMSIKLVFLKRDMQNLWLNDFIQAPGSILGRRHFENLILMNIHFDFSTTGQVGQRTYLDHPN